MTVNAVDSIVCFVQIPCIFPISDTSSRLDPFETLSWLVHDCDIHYFASSFTNIMFGFAFPDLICFQFTLLPITGAFGCFYLSSFLLNAFSLAILLLLVMK
ncbi:hypothetical protein AHF37_10238 [Paragonimus kellicotti]|nr:hypothetical protein AHF37_10238 [Paragonimus kellicotti]